MFFYRTQFIHLFILLHCVLCTVREAAAGSRQTTNELQELPLFSFAPTPCKYMCFFLSIMRLWAQEKGPPAIHDTISMHIHRVHRVCRVLSTFLHIAADQVWLRRGARCTRGKVIIFTQGPKQLINCYLLIPSLAQHVTSENLDLVNGYFPDAR